MPREESAKLLTSQAPTSAPACCCLLVGREQQGGPPQAGVRLGGPGGNAPSRAPQGSADHALRTARLAPSLGTRRRSSFVEVEEDVHAASDFSFKSLGDLVNRK